MTERTIITDTLARREPPRSMIIPMQAVGYRAISSSVEQQQDECGCCAINTFMGATLLQNMVVSKVLRRPTHSAGLTGTDVGYDMNRDERQKRECQDGHLKKR
jgi:hypothetical protein